MHIYTSPSGKELPSVTTVLQIINMGDGIAKWANYLGFKHIKYQDELDRRATIGTDVHNYIRTIVDSSCEEIVSETVKFYHGDKINRFKKEMSNYSYKTIFTEKTFLSDSLGYGGTIDWYTNINGINMLVDFKTSKAVSLKHLLQLGGYYNLMLDSGIEDVQGGAIMLVGDKSYLFPIGLNDLRVLGKTFNIVYEVYKSIDGYKVSEDKDLKDKLKNKGD